ncbi:MAG: AAA family ATPase [Candidatus Micrarchaeota archaeon]|nr:AAA family ATPase [Candidatus Micrarchaeota archaeon]
MAGSGTGEEREVKTIVSQQVIRKYHTTPLFLYRLKDFIVDIKTNDNFIDALLIVTAFISMWAALPSYPIIIVVILSLVIFFACLRHGFMGLLVMLLLSLPMVMYQVPAISEIYVIIMSMAMVYGFMHHRTIAFLYILVTLPFSALGAFLSIPFFILSILIVGHKRAAVIGVIAVLGIVMLSGLTGYHNTGYIPYNPNVPHEAVNSTPIALYSTLTPKRPLLTIFNANGIISGYASATNSNLINNDAYAFYGMFSPLGYEPAGYLIFIGFLVMTTILTDMVAIGSRSRYHGTEASLVCSIYPFAYILVTYLYGGSITSMVFLTSIISMVLGLGFIFALEASGIDIVYSLDVRKEDLRMKFGDAFEDLASETTRERFGDIGNYESTKKELQDAIIFPIEEKGVSRAYNVKPVRGVLLFGPPGTGKTMIMKALANEIHVGFYLIKASNLVSAMPGETERRLANVFKIARKNQPCVLFIDEIDSIARSRQRAMVDESRRAMLTQILMEMDGFKRSDRVIVVGATNAPQILDQALMRPGRFDRIIYMPLPDYNGRKEIFKKYLSKLPASAKIKIEELSKMSERYSGADIRNVCESIAQEVAQEAVHEHKVLEITHEDLVSAIKRVKPATSMAQVKAYNTFKIDFERRVLGQNVVEKGKVTMMRDVVGLEDAKRAIKDAVEIPLVHPELVKKYGVSPIKGVLMFGPPGNGKTMLLSSILNGMSDVTVLQISASELANEDPKNAVSAVKKIFNRAAENIPSVILIDEVDSIIPSRRHASEQGIQVTNEILQQIDGVRENDGIVIVGATNRPEALDPAMLRPGRFDKLIYVRPPNEAERAEMFKLYLKGAPVDTIDFVELGKESEGFTGADINNICREVKTEALRMASESGKDMVIEMSDIQKLVSQFKPSAPESELKAYKDFLQKYGER